MPLSPGVRLGPYEIVAPLGSGGMGEVYRASDTRLRRDVAIKILPAELAGDPERLRRFEQEALAAASLNHPNILAVFDIDLAAPCTYIVSELLEGHTLRTALENGAVPVRKTLDYAVQIASGLAAAHEKGIVHRDLKPENLFVTSDGRVKILDFGLAKLTQPESLPAGVSNLVTGVQKTEPGMIVGTIGYMSPEQVRGAPADHRSDIFSFALVLHEMLSGRRAFAGPSAVETMHAILTQDPPDLVRPDGPVPPALDRIIRRCLEKGPEQRFQSARDLAFNLQALSSDSDARRVSVDEPVPPRDRRLLRAGAAALLLVAAAAAGFLAAGTLRGAPLPTFTRITYRRGVVQSARFAPDGQTIVYSAAWQGRPTSLFSTRLGSPESRVVGPDGAIVTSISPAGDMALRLRNLTLARAPLAGGAPREILEHVVDATWAPGGQTFAIIRTEGSRARIEFPPGKVLYETVGQILDIALSHDAKSIAYVESTRGIGLVTSIGVVDLNGARKTLSENWRGSRGLAWSPRGDEIWFAGSRANYGPGGLFGVTPAGRLREILKIPGPVRLYDVFADGKTLIGRVDTRVEASGLAPGDEKERDLSWFDVTGLSALSADGRTMIITEDSAAGLKVYSRKTDGSPAAEIGDGGCFDLSPDGRFVLVQTLNPLRFSILPVGAGEPRTIPRPGFESYAWANWFPDGKRILFAGSEGGHGMRVYVEDLDGGTRRAITPEGTTLSTGSVAISPDGTRVAAMTSGRIVMYPVDGNSSPVPLPGVERGTVPSRWSPDGRFLYVYRRDELPAPVYRVDVASGRRELWKTIGPSDQAGVNGLAHVMITPDAASYVYNYSRSLSDLYLVEGLK